MMKPFLSAMFSVFLAVASAFAQAIPPLPGKVTELREPPADAPHGKTTNGLHLGLWCEKDTYELNSRINAWVILSNTNKNSSGRIIPYDPAIHKDDYLIITDEGGNQVKIKGEHPFDGPVGLGFQGGISGQLHEKIRHSGAYRLQWKIGTMESNVIGIRVTAPASSDLALTAKLAEISQKVKAGEEKYFQGHSSDKLDGKQILSMLRRVDFQNTHSSRMQTGTDRVFISYHNPEHFFVILSKTNAGWDFSIGLCD